MAYGVLLGITGGGYAKLKERQDSKELLDPDTPSASKMSADGADEGLMTESKAEQSSVTPGRQSVGLLAGTARLMKRAVATADRYKQFIDADIDTEAAPITSSDCEVDVQSDVSDEVDESQAPHQPLSDSQHSKKLSLPHVFTPVAATTVVAPGSSSHQQAFHGKTTASCDDTGSKHAVRRRPAKPDLSSHAPIANPFSAGKIMPLASYEPGVSASANSAPFHRDKMDVFGAAPFRRRAGDNKTESVDTVDELDVFANVPFARQQEKVTKVASSVSSSVVCMPNPVLVDATVSGNSSSRTVSYNTSGMYLTQSARFNQSSTGPMSAAFEPIDDSHTYIVSTLSSAVQPYAVEMAELSAYAQQDSGPLLASLPLSVASECPDHLVSSSKASLYLPVLPSDAAQSAHEDPQAAEECHGSLKKGWLAKLRSDKESPTTAITNLGFSDDPDAVVPTSTVLPGSDLSFHDDLVDPASEPRSPPMVSESNFLLPSTEGSNTLPKVSVRKQMSHEQQHMPLMSPDAESFTVAKKGIALL